MQNETLLPYYLQQQEFTITQLTSFSQNLNAAKSLQMTMKPYINGRSVPLPRIGTVKFAAAVRKRRGRR